VLVARRSGSQVVEIVTAAITRTPQSTFLEGATSEKSPPRTVVDQLAPQSTDFSLSLLSTFIGERPVLLVLFFPPAAAAAARHHTKHST
jgi:hypothetical protein